MTISCSRCKVKRVVGKTDFTIADLSNYKTCISCRNKLKEYRRVHVKKRRRVENEKKNSSDDRIDVSIVPSAVETKKAQGKKKAIEFKEFLEIIYNDVKRQDLVINETVLVDNFTLPRNMTGLTGNVFVKKKRSKCGHFRFV